MTEELTWREAKLVEESRQLRIAFQTEQQLRRQVQSKLRMLTKKEPKDLKIVTLGQIYSKIFEKGWKPVWSEAYYKAEDVVPVLAKAEEKIKSLELLLTDKQKVAAKLVSVAQEASP